MKSNSIFTLHSLSAAQTLPIRHQVLWPTKAPEFCQVDGDKHALHFGVRADQQLVGVASLYREGKTDTVRLRKFATLEAFQHQGVGSMLMQHMLDTATEQGIQYFWCNARESAYPFYQRFGLQTEGKRFYQSGIAYFKMGIRLEQQN